MTIYYEPQEEFEVWDTDRDFNRYFVGYCYGWEAAEYYSWCGYIVI